jgi:actin-related protein 10
MLPILTQKRSLQYLLHPVICSRYSQWDECRDLCLTQVIWNQQSYLSVFICAPADCWNTQSFIKVVASRPLYPFLRTTPLAGARLTSHIRALLLVFGTYLPPPTSLSGAANIPTATRSTRVPQEVLTDAVIEEIKTRCCFVGTALDLPSERSSTPLAVPPDDSMSVDVPPSEPPSESSVSRVSGSIDMGSSRHSSSPSITSDAAHSMGPHSQARPTESHLQAIATMYTRHSTATDLSIKVIPPVVQQMGTGRGTLIIPGWIRERAAEFLFAGGDLDECSVAEVVLESLLKVRVPGHLSLNITEASKIGSSRPP